MTANEKKQLMAAACKVRMGVIKGTHAAKAGHPGGSLSAADLFTYLYCKELNVDPKDPNWADRDRFVLSKGHTAPGLYAALALRGFFPEEDLLTLRHIGSYLQGHPNMNTVPGVDMSTGSLGQGVSAACGMALAARQQGKSSRVYTLLGDGEIQEGQVWEAMMFAHHYKLDNLCVIIDNNGLQIDGNVADVMSPYPIPEKLRAFGFEVAEIDGHPEGEQNGVGRRQAHPAQDQLEHRGPEGAGAKLLIFPSSLHQIQQLGSVDLDAAEAHDQQENQAEVEHSAPRRPGGEGQPEGVHPKGEHGQGEGGQALRGRQSQQQAQGQGGRADQPRLQHQQKGYLPLAQAKKQIGAQLPLPPAHEEPVGVQDQTGQNHRHKDGKDVDAGLDDLGHGILALGQVDHRPLSIQRAEGIEQAHAEGEGKQIHAVVPEGAADVAQGQLTEHLPSLLPAG